MSYSLKVNFSRRFGKTNGYNKISNYDLKKQLNNLETNLAKRKLYVSYLSEIFKHDLFLREWLYYEDYDIFIGNFKNYVLTIDDEYFNLIVDSEIHLKNLVEIFLMEQLDPKLKDEYVYETALEEHKKAVEKNGYTFNEKDKYKGFNLTLREMDYRKRNEDVYQKVFDLTKELKYARNDDILHMRTEENWKILYSLRYLYKNVVNKILSDTQNTDTTFQYNQINNNPRKFSFDETIPVSELYKIKKNIEDYLMLFQDSSEGLDWHNPYSNKLIESIEYFPRETSKPPHDYAYSVYHDLENTALSNVIEMINQRKRKRDEANNEVAERLNKIHKLMEERNNRIQRITNFIVYGIKYGSFISMAVGFTAIAYYYFF